MPNPSAGKHLNRLTSTMLASNSTLVASDAIQRSSSS